MKLILEYYSGSEYDGSHITTPFEYETKERAESDFATLLLMYYNLLELYHKQIDIYYKINNKKNMPYPKMPETSFYFCNHEFDYRDFVYYRDGKLQIEPPAIRTLEDWFEENRIN